MKLCCPISSCGVSSLTTIAFRLEACNFDDQDRVSLASWKNKRGVFISHEERGSTKRVVVSASSGRVESTLTVAGLTVLLLVIKAEIALKVKVRKDRNCYGEVKNNRRRWSWWDTECLKIFTLSLKSCCCMSNVPLHNIALVCRNAVFPLDKPRDAFILL